MFGQAYDIFGMTTLCVECLLCDSFSTVHTHIILGMPMKYCDIYVLLVLGDLWARSMIGMVLCCNDSMLWALDNTYQFVPMHIDVLADT